MNKKIKGATLKTVNNITFKSHFEASVYNTLLQEGFNPKYEEVTYTIMSGYYPTINYYTGKRKQLLKKSTHKIRDITYTPDFTFFYNNKLIIIEVKGFENDTFPLKNKLFLNYLEDLYKKGNIEYPIFYFVIYDKQHLLQTISIIKQELLISMS